MASRMKTSVRRNHSKDLTSLQESSVLADAEPLKTVEVNKFWVRTLESFRSEEGVPIDLQSFSTVNIVDCLRQFYFGLMVKKGKTYS